MAERPAAVESAKIVDLSVLGAFEKRLLYLAEDSLDFEGFWR